MQLTVAGTVLSRALFGIQLPQCTNARSSSSLHSGKCHCDINVAHVIAIPGGISSLCSLGDYSQYFTIVSLEQSIRKRTWVLCIQEKGENYE